MATFLPTGHMSAAFGTVYMFALELRRLCDSEAPDHPDNIPANLSLYKIAFRDRHPYVTERIRLKIDQVEIEPIGSPKDKYDCIFINTSARDGRDISDFSSIITFIPPYTKCVGRKDNFHVLPLSSIDIHMGKAETVDWFRRQLVAGSVQGYVTCDNGMVKAIPPNYWNSDQCFDVLKYDVSTLIKSEEGDFFGRVSFPKAEIDALFLAPSISATPLEPNNSAGPYLQFMNRAAVALGMVGGLQPDGTTMPKTEIRAWLEANWPPELGQRTKNHVEGMITFLRNVESARGGRPKPVIGFELPKGQKPPSR